MRLLTSSHTSADITASSGDDGISRARSSFRMWPASHDRRLRLAVPTRNCAISSIGRCRPHPEARPGPRDSVVAARGGDVGGGVGRGQQPHRRADFAAPHDARIREHAPPRRADAMQLSERIGAEHVTSHHGSLSREKAVRGGRAPEARRAAGSCCHCVLGAGHRHRSRRSRHSGRIDAIDCHVLQPRGRAGHRLGAVPKGRVFPLSRDELIECAALTQGDPRGPARSAYHPRQTARHPGAADRSRGGRGGVERERSLRPRAFRVPRIGISHAPNSTTSCRCSPRASRPGADVRSAHIHYDGINKKLTGRRGARIAAITSGGAIRIWAIYRVILEPTETFVGTLNEDFAIESTPGDIFQLGNTSYQIVKGRVGASARGRRERPTADAAVLAREAPGRTKRAGRKRSPGCVRTWRTAWTIRRPQSNGSSQTIGHRRTWCSDDRRIPRATRQILGTIPTQQCLVLEALLR